MRRFWFVSLMVCGAQAATGSLPALPDPLSARPIVAQVAQQPTFGAEVARVRVDVVAIDDEGRFVGDLTADDFSVFEDGEPQDVISVQLVDVAEGRVTEPRVVGARAPDADTVVARERDSGTAPRIRSDLGAVIFLVDGLGLSVRNQVRFSMRWSAELDQRAGLVVPHALYRIDRIGQTGEIVSLTHDIATFREGVDRLAELADTDLFRDLRIREPNLQRFDVLKQFCEALAGRSGRTVLVYVSTGISLMTRGMPDTRVLSLQEQMHEAANGANVTFHSLDPSLMYEIIGTGINMAAKSGTSERARAGSSRDRLGDSLRHAATATGGQAFVGWADLGRALDIIEQDTRRYYLLTYSPARADSDGAFHELKVEVSRPGVHLRSRRGYVDHPREVRETKRVMGALALPGATGSMPTIVEAFRTRSASGEMTHRVRVAVEPDALDVALLDGVTPVVRATVHIGVVDGRGDTVEYASAPITRRLGEVGGGRTIGDAAPSDAPLTYSEVLDLPPGDYELKVAVVDEIGDRLGAVSLSITVPHEDDAWATSGIVLELSRDGASPEPVIGGRVQLGDRVTATLELYETGEFDFKARLLAASGTVLADDLPWTMSADGSGAEQLSIDVPTPGAGGYVLEVEVIGLPRGTGVLRTPVRVFPR